MIRFLKDADPKTFRGTALLRLDFNTKDDWRMRAVLPTIKFLLKGPCKIVIVSHRGRPTNVTLKNGVPSGFERDLSLKKDAAVLGRLLGRKVVFINHFRFADIKRAVAKAPGHTVFLLENLRFMKGEEANSAGFARELASLADFYVNDAFAVSHRANASVAAAAKLFSRRFAGFELEKEITFLSRATVKPRHPVVLILGGVKAADKLGVINYFKNKADWFLLGGGPANTILFLNGMNVKNSTRDKDAKDLRELKPVAHYKNLVLPKDFIWYKGAIVDYGPKTFKDFLAKIKTARTIIWSGPPTLFEIKPFERGSLIIAKAVVANRRAFTLSGGGETVMFLKRYKLDKKFSFISTGGGAMVDFLAGKKLPGIEALK